MLNASQISNCILLKSSPEVGDNISNLKLQKLLYYCQGFHLALYGSKFFEEDLYAWQYGPVVPPVYHAYKENGSDIIFPNLDFDTTILSTEQNELIDEIYSVYGQLSALKLMNMTHQELPWITTEIGQIISDEKMIRFFKTRIKSHEE